MTTTESGYQQAAPEPGAAPPPRSGRSATARALMVIGIVLAALVVLRVAVLLIDLSLVRTTTTHASYDAVGVVELVADDDVTVRVADGAGTVEVDKVARGGLTSPVYRVQESGDRLVVTHECGRWTWFTECGGGLDVTLPADTELVVRSSNGDVRASGVAGDVDLTSSNGDVEAASIGGRLDVYSSNGDVVVDQAGGDTEARSSNGDVEVSDVGGSLVVDSSNGRVDVVSVAGSVVAESSNGRVDVADAAGDVRATSSNGDVTVTGDGEPVRLLINTSNGNQTIEGATDPDADRTVEIRSSNGDVSYLVR
ncbi:DUF4097 domain-containing protein [Isoptericola sp. NEAU-Y5]|uniref:DUF4097 domain-containing protein n=1 Tax=Isoptericola luteus TaxID=2879484 RepID=A0ABS7ZH00_9MICO|nr:DUF4097 family beta strand repeat-containing protein [Isoptericola sp. NEAU-Y5]MCA5894293.1 DUF4097 domain-containing protein [Isoptericola sp. NEAU-Y5]